MIFLDFTQIDGFFLIGRLRVNINKATLYWLKEIMAKAETRFMDIILVPRFPAPWSYVEKGGASWVWGRYSLFYLY